MLLHRVSRTIERNELLSPEDTVIIGVSGGSDSMALLHILREIIPSLKCVAVYVDHGLRPGETEREIATIREAAARLGVVFHTESVAVADYAAARGCSLEDAGRTLRYRVLERIREQYDAPAIAVAHTADDQAEEFFVRLCRGTGLKGLSGMTLHNGRIIRPLLFEKKQTLLDYLDRNNIPWGFDSSNEDRRFLRNRVRLDLLPELELHFNPAMRQTILQTMEILQQENDLLEDLTEQALRSFHQAESTAVTDGLALQIEIPLALFQVEHPALQRRILEKICWQMDCRPGFRQIELLLSLISKGENGGETHLEGGLRVCKTPESLLFSYPAGREGFRGSGQETVLIDEVITGPGVHTFSGLGRILSIDLAKSSEIGQLDRKEKLYLDAGKISFPLRFRSISPGQRFRPYGARGSKKLLRFFSDRKVPARKRQLYPALLAEERVIAVPGLEIDHDFRVTPETTSILVVAWREMLPEDRSAGTDL